VGAIDVGDRQLEPGASLDLGDLRFAAPGTLSIELRADDATANKLSFRVTQSLPPYPDGRSAIGYTRTFERRELPGALSLPPGKYWLYVTGAKVEVQKQQFDIASDRETRVTVGARAACFAKCGSSSPRVNPRPMCSSRFGRRSATAAAVLRSFAGPGEAIGTCLLAAGAWTLDACTFARHQARKDVTIARGSGHVVVKVELASPWLAGGTDLKFRSAARQQPTHGDSSSPSDGLMGGALRTPVLRSRSVRPKLVASRFPWAGASSRAPGVSRLVTTSPLRFPMGRRRCRSARIRSRRSTRSGFRHRVRRQTIEIPIELP